MQRAFEDKEYLDLVEDILQNESFRKTMYIEHHGDNIYKHSIRVSYNAYLVAKKSGLDYVSVARGGLLHDFTLEHWKDQERKFYEFHKMHGFLHPKVARENAIKEFGVNDKEADIIVKHMFPLTITPPRHMESWLVSGIDKTVAAQEIAEDTKAMVKTFVLSMKEKFRLRKKAKVSPY